MKNFTPKNYKWSLKGLEKCIEENGMESEIIYATPSAAIVAVKNYEESTSLGRVTDWCICQHGCSWRDYVESDGNRLQLFFYNFGLPYDNNLSVVGATLKLCPGGGFKLLHCFSRENKPLCEKLLVDSRKGDLYALDELVMKRQFNSIPLSEIVNGLYTPKYKNTEVSLEKSWVDLDKQKQSIDEKVREFEAFNDSFNAVHSKGYLLDFEDDYYDWLYE